MHWMECAHEVAAHKNERSGQLGDVEGSQAYSRVFMMNGALQKKRKICSAPGLPKWSPTLVLTELVPA
jgi:hypothetical protein